MKPIHFLITGAGFGNSGAQSMMFSLVDELSSRFADCKITIENTSSLPSKFEDIVRFKYVMTGVGEIYSISGIATKIKYRIKQVIKTILGKNPIPLKLFEELVSGADVVLDISGYALSSKWNYNANLRLLSRIEMAHRYGKPIILLPQSFGPFDYKGKKGLYLFERIKKDLKYVNLICAREKQGYDVLSKELHLTNVILSPDIVLQSKNSCFEKYKQGNNQDRQNKILIIPNVHCYDYNPERLIQAYFSIISYLLKDGKEIVIARHSEQDACICKKVKDLFPLDTRVILNNELMDSMRFCSFVSRFDFAIASRYHSIVHAFKMNTPCIAIGWASKYNELLGLFNQSKFVNNIGDLKDSSIIIEQIKEMDAKLYQNKEMISKQMTLLHNSNIFDQLESRLRMFCHV